MVKCAAVIEMLTEQHFAQDVAMEDFLQLKDLVTRCKNMP